jgi:hypothetical protein
MQTDRYCFSWMILQNICSAIFLFLDLQSNIGFFVLRYFLSYGVFYISRREIEKIRSR